MGCDPVDRSQDRLLGEALRNRVRAPARALPDRRRLPCAADIEAAHAAGTAVYAPSSRGKAGGDPHRGAGTDAPGIAAWRTRMATQPAKDIYLRRSRCELVHARLRNLGLDRPPVRGLRMLATWMTGLARTMNILTECRLRTKACIQ